jgi:FAD/FMN-containing dehydrogenase
MKPRPEPLEQPINGLVLIGLSVIAAIIGGVWVSSDEAAVGGFVAIGIAGLLYLAGVIRWAVSGAEMVQLNRLHRQNIEIIRLLKLIASRGDDEGELGLIKRLWKSGQLSEEDYLKRRRELLGD